MNKTENKSFKVQNRTIWIYCLLSLLFVFIMESENLFPLDCPLLGHDAQYHYLRVDALAERIKSGNIFSGGVDYLFLDGLGYASSLAYPDVLLYIPALMRVAGCGIGESMAIFLMICNALCLLSSFWCMYRISKSPVCAAVAAVVFSTSFYRIDNMYTRFALGEVQAFIFWPLIIYGLYDFIFEDFKKPYVLGLGIVGMFFTHTISTALAVILCVLICLIFIKRIIKSPKKILKLAVTAVCVLAVTSFYWMPLLELMGSCELTVKYPINKASNFTVEFMTLFKDTSIGYGNAGLGILLFAVCGIRVFVKPQGKKDEISQDILRKRELLKFADVCLILAFVFLFLTAKTPAWKLLAPLLDFMQFSWRMFAVVTLLISIAVAVYAYLLATTFRISVFLPLVASVVFVLNVAIHMQTVGAGGHAAPYNDDYYTGNPEATYYIGYGEWLPWSAKNSIDTLKQNTRKVTSNDGTELKYEKKSDYLVFTPDKTYEYAVVPYIWYKGYVAYDEGGNEYKTSISDIGLVKVELDGREPEGDIRVEYRFTTWRTVSVAISSVSAVFILAYFVAAGVRKNKKGKDSPKEDSTEEIKEENTEEPEEETQEEQISVEIKQTEEI